MPVLFILLNVLKKKIDPPISTSRKICLQCWIFPLFLYKCGKLFFIKPSLKIIICAVSYFSLILKFFVDKCKSYWPVEWTNRLSLLVLLLLWVCHCDKKWEYLAAFLALQPKLKEHSLRQELEVLFQLSPVFTWELSCPDFLWVWVIYGFVFLSCPMHSLFLFPLQFLRSAVIIHQELAEISFSPSKIQPNLLVK